MYLTDATRPGIAFSVNLLARYSSSTTRRYWDGIKHILRYLKGTLDMDLLYSNKGSANLVGYADTGYLSDPYKARSQTEYVFTCGAQFAEPSAILSTTVAEYNVKFQVEKLDFAGKRVFFGGPLIRTGQKIFVLIIIRSFSNV
ncbi:uncharacterized mitochondrial protein AtMg00240-like [Nicotiana tomentosiformis]|uniref:uncharacterized mitochondrial protein AtMg00240-like n=1 Tax=Nicotiana tomentosiformis TaxID=4098 RepID=UPI00388C52AD